MNIELLKKKAEETNNVEMFIEIGNAYFRGKEVVKDLSQAAFYYKKAADLGSVDGKSKIGICYYRGYGVAKNCNLAKNYLKDAADCGDVYALVELGWMCYNQDYGFLASKGKAFTYWMKAAKKGNADSQYYVATSYLGDTWGAEQSYEKAAYWFMCAYQNRKASNKVIEDSKKQLNRLSDLVNLTAIKEEIVRKHPEYLNLS